MSDEEISKVLDGLLKHDDIITCMVARQNMISVMPSDRTDSFKPEISQIWNTVKQTMDAQFGVIMQFPGYNTLTYRFMDYEVIMYVLPDAKNALVAITPTLANKGVITIEMENARREIINIMETYNQQK